MDKNKFIKNFSSLNNWEEKYLYIIELGKQLTPFPNKFKQSTYLVPGCQNLVWIALLYEKNNLKFYGDSNSIIVKGLIAILFIFYQNLKISEVIKCDAYPYLKNLCLSEHLTPSRMQGLGAIISFIKNLARSCI